MGNCSYGLCGGGQSSAQIYKSVKKRGHNCLYLNPLRNIREQKKLIARDDDSQKIVICEFPDKIFLKLCLYLRKKGAIIIYRNVDDWQNMPDNSWYSQKVEIKLIKLADYCFASTDSIIRKLQHIRTIELLPNAVDIEQFRKKPAVEPKDLHQGEITVGFWGLLARWIDLELIFETAAKMPQWSFNIIGPDYFNRLAQHKNIPSNVYFLGEKKISDLHKFAYYFDVCILPCRLNSLEIKNSHPMKILEYLASYKPVVTGNTIESIRKYPYIFTYKNEKEFIKQIERVKKTKINKNKIDLFLKDKTWDHFINIILNKVKAL